MSAEELQRLLDQRNLLEGLAVAMASQVMEQAVQHAEIEVISELFRLGQKPIKIHPDDLRNAALTLNDFADHLEILAFLKKGDVVSAAKTASTLETASRDKVPASVWNMLLKYMPTQS